MYRPQGFLSEILHNMNILVNQFRKKELILIHILVKIQMLTQMFVKQIKAIKSAQFVIFKIILFLFPNYNSPFCRIISNNPFIKDSLRTICVKISSVA